MLCVAPRVKTTWGADDAATDGRSCEPGIAGADGPGVNVIVVLDTSLFGVMVMMFDER